MMPDEALSRFALDCPAILPGLLKGNADRDLPRSLSFSHPGSRLPALEPTVRKALGPSHHERFRPSALAHVLKRKRSLLRVLSAILSSALCLVSTRAVLAQQTPAAAIGGLSAGPSQQIGNSNVGPLFTPPFDSPHLFGDWGGVRSPLADHGVYVRLDYLTEDFGNVTGGRSTGFDYVGQVGAEFDLDLGRLAGLNGFSSHTLVVQRAGRNLSADRLGDGLGTVQEIYGAGGDVLVHLVYTYLEQVLADHRVDIVVGRLPVGTFFAASPLYCAFVNGLTCGNPHPLPIYAGSFDWPLSTFGGQFRVLPMPETYVMAGAWQVNPNYGGRSGFAWGEPGTTGVSLPLEVGYVPRIGRQDLIGHYKIGYDYDSSRYPALLRTGSSSSPIKSRSEFYALADQMLLRTGPSDTDGVVLFGGYVHADPGVSALADQLFGGVSSTGAPFGRPRDSFGAIFHWIRTSGSLTATQERQAAFGGSFSNGGFGPVFGTQTHEQVIEVEYTTPIARGVSIEPDFQYIMRPGATSATRSAAVLGVRTNIHF